jgi:hypothetical protein
MAGGGQGRPVRVDGSYSQARTDATAVQAGMTDMAAAPSAAGRAQARSAGVSCTPAHDPSHIRKRRRFSGLASTSTRASGQRRVRAPKGQGQDCQRQHVTGLLGLPWGLFLCSCHNSTTPVGRRPSQTSQTAPRVSLAGSAQGLCEYCKFVDIICTYAATAQPLVKPYHQAAAKADRETAGIGDMCSSLSPP